MSDRRIRVLLADDSAVARSLLQHVLEADPVLSVCAAVDSGAAAVEAVRRLRPDVVVMDIRMPGVDGFEATRRIMQSDPLPIVICSAADDVHDVETAFRALECGAVACVQKPVGPTHPDHARAAAELVQTVRLMAAVKVVRRWPRRAADAASGPAPARGVVAIGASTGGPAVLQTILGALPKTFPLPIVIVQHISTGFVAGLASWLGQTTGFQVQLAASGVRPLPGHVYLAPDDYHLSLAGDGRLRLTREAAEHGLRPAVAQLFRSLVPLGAAAAGVLLTGMGRDGALELRQLRDAGALTIAQDRESSVVFGMPGEAVRLDAARHVLAPEAIAPVLTSWADRTASSLHARSDR